MHIYIGNSTLATYGACFLLALFFSLVLTWILTKILPRLGILDAPGPIKIHSKPVPRMGGVAIYAAFATPMILLLYYDLPQKGIIIGGGLALIVGMLDDIVGIRATIKLMALIILTIFLKTFGVQANLPLGFLGAIGNEVANTALSVLWIVGVTSAMNALDHMDGLAAGTALMACLSYLAVSLQTSNFFWGLLSICLAGSLIGFLTFNWHPAKIFMGDCGSFFLGFTLAATGLMGGWSQNPLKSALVPIFILSLPIFDLARVIISRHLRGITKSLAESITYCGKDHIGHRLLDMGFDQRKAALILLLLSATVSISALTIRDVKALEAVFLATQIICIYIIALLFFEQPIIGRHVKGLENDPIEKLRT